MTFSERGFSISRFPHTRLAYASFCAVFLMGCTGSRWAKDDPDYAAKYPTHTDNVAKTVKQAIDARHLRDKGGVYAAVSGRDDPTAMGGEVGIFVTPRRSWSAVVGWLD
jgi:hypothetical protein